MEPLTPRQADILGRARQVGRVEVEGLSLQFDVTPQTIRKQHRTISDPYVEEDSESVLNGSCFHLSVFRKG